MARSAHTLRACRTARIQIQAQPPTRSYTTLNPGKGTDRKPRHFLSIKDLTPSELKILINNATTHKKALQARHSWPLASSLAGQTIPMLFSKLSTRTRVSTEAAVSAMGGHPMFLGRNDIQLGTNETLYDTSVVISSMTAGIVARVGPHKDIADLAQHSSVPVINALCDTFHPMQILADFACLCQTLGVSAEGLKGLKIAWVGDANNVLYDMAIGAAKLGIEMSVATPRGYEIPRNIQQMITSAGGSKMSETGGGRLFETNTPEEAVRGANVIMTDTWVSMGQEEETLKRLRAFEGFQVTEKLAERGGAKSDWKFMHCLPRHKEEVDDHVFYGSRSLVFPEAQNRLWAAIAALEGFIVNKGEIKKTSI